MLLTIIKASLNLTTSQQQIADLSQSKIEEDRISSPSLTDFHHLLNLNFCAKLLPEKCTSLLG